MTTDQAPLEDRLLLAAIVESSEDAILSKTLDGTVTSWNAAAERMYQYTAEEMIGRSVGILMPPEWPEELPSIMARVRRGERIQHYETVRVRKDGTRLNVSVSISPVRDASGRIVGAAAIARDITAQKRVERELRSSREQLDAILRGVADGITVQGPDGSLLYANDTAATLIGLPSAEALLATPVAEIMARFQVLDEAGRPLPLSELPGRKALAGERPPPMSLRFRVLATGAERWSMVGAAPVFDDEGRVCFAINIFHEITEQKLSERRLRFLAEASVLLAASLDYASTLQTVARLAVPSIADWCVVDLLEPDGCIRRVAAAHSDPAVEPAIRGFYDQRPLDPQGSHPIAVVLRTGAPVFMSEVSDAHLESIARDETHLAALRAASPRSGMIVPMVARGRTVGALSLAAQQPGRYGERDQALAMDLAHRCALALENARLFDEAQRAVQARNEFLSVAAHELKTPMTALLGQVQLLSRRIQRGDKPELEEVRQRLDTVEEQTRKLARLTGQLLDVSRLEAGRMDLERESIDLARLVRSVATAAASTTLQHTLVVRAPEQLWAEVDPLRVEQVIFNLLNNAIRYAPGGEIEVEVAAARDGWIRLSVRDHGPGIPEDSLERVFERFYRAQANGVVTGMGLGLNICRQVVELHGGRIWAERPADGGTRFVVRLPAQASQAAAPSG
jgi:PAS domain S-box-containing protein